MNYLSIIGLTLDLIGVLMLGVDLVRVQRKLRADAVDRLLTLADVAEAHDGIDKWLDEMGRNADWREHQRDEGRYLPMGGTFASEAARDSFKEALGYISQIGGDLHKLAKMMVATVEADRKTASMSLFVTYGGLLLISVGFLLQLIAQF